MSDAENDEQFNLLQTITMEVGAAGDIGSALEIVLRRVCEKTNWALGQAWLPNKQKTLLECGPVWLCGGPKLADFRAASEKNQFAPGVGLPGRGVGPRRDPGLERAWAACLLPPGRRGNRAGPSSLCAGGDPEARLCP